VTIHSLVTTKRSRRGRGQQERWNNVTQRQLISQCCRILEVVHQRQTIPGIDGDNDIGTLELSRSMGRDKRYILPILRRLSKSNLVKQARSGKGKKWPWRLTPESSQIMSTKSDLDNALESVHTLRQTAIVEMQRLPKTQRHVNGPGRAWYQGQWTQLIMLISSKYGSFRRKIVGNALAADILTYFMTSQIEKLSKIYEDGSAEASASDVFDRSNSIIEELGAFCFDGISDNIQIRNAIVDVALALLRLVNPNEENCAALEKDILLWYHTNGYSIASRMMIESFLSGAKKIIPQLVIPGDLSKYRLYPEVEPYKVLCDDPSDSYYVRLKKLRGGKD
jgi:hypothetical protein